MNIPITDTKATSAILRTGLCLFLLMCLFGGCADKQGTGEDSGAVLRLATTTSTQASGLLDVLLPAFEKQQGVRVDVIAVGTGKALKLGEDGEVDVLLVHAPEAEKAFVENGHGINRRSVMYNDFVIVGPESNPAGVLRDDKGADALKRIAEAEALFVSRGDDSGTHKKELSLWRASDMHPSGAWYLEVGQGMGATLVVADEKRAYCLADRGTFLAYRDKVLLEVLCEGDPFLHNPYSVIAVNPADHPHVQQAHAMAFVEWITSPKAQEIIRQFKKNGDVLFHPNPETLRTN